VVVIAAQTEGDTGYDYNDAYEDSYDESSGQLVVVHFTLIGQHHLPYKSMIVL